MAIPLLPRWNLQPGRPTFYDTDSATMLELAAKMQATFNLMVEDYNKFTDKLNGQMQLFMDATNADQATFQVAIRQEFQDFINVIDLKIADMERSIENMEDIVKAQVGEAIKTGVIDVTEHYDPDAESLTIYVTGGI